MMTSIFPIVLTDFIVHSFMILSSMMTGTLDTIHSIPVIMAGGMTRIMPIPGDGVIHTTTTIIHLLHGDLADTWDMVTGIPIIMDTTMVTTADTMAMEAVSMTTIRLPEEDPLK